MIGSNFGGLPRKGRSSQGTPAQNGPFVGVAPVVIGKHSTVINAISKPSSAEAGKAKENFRKKGTISVGFVGQLHDNCGYGQAARLYVASLSLVGVNVNAESTSSKRTLDYGEAGRQADRCVANRSPYVIKIVVLTPDAFQNHSEPGVYKIGIFYWEADFLPAHWVQSCNAMDEIWVSCHWTADVAKRSGVRKPIFVFANSVRPEDYKLDGKTTSFPGVDPKSFKFLSVFQWTERKNPDGLLRAYLRAFSNKDKVVLLLKTYLISPGDDRDRNEIVNQVQSIIKTERGTARVYVITHALTQGEMFSLYRSSDAFALIHRAEGFGLPLLEAAAMGKPVISTNYSAPLDFLKPDWSYLVSHTLTPIRGMAPRFTIYNDAMNWANPDLMECSKKMRQIYENQEEAKQKGLAARKFVLENFSWASVGNKMKDRLSEILEQIT